MDYYTKNLSKINDLIFNEEILQKQYKLKTIQSSLIKINWLKNVLLNENKILMLKSYLESYLNYTKKIYKSIYNKFYNDIFFNEIKEFRDVLAHEEIIYSIKEKDKAIILSVKLKKLVGIHI